MKRPTSTLGLVTTLASLLGVWMTAHGLFIRITGTYMPLQSSLLFGFRAPWELPRGYSLVVAPSIMAWPLLAFGLAWLGVILGLWLRSRWSLNFTLLFAAACSLVLGVGSLLSVAILTIMLASSLRRWMDVDKGDYDQGLDPDPLH